MFESLIDTIGEGAWFEKEYRRFFCLFFREIDITPTKTNF